MGYCHSVATHHVHFHAMGRRVGCFTFLLPMNYGRMSDGKLRRTADGEKRRRRDTNAYVVIQCQLVVVNDS